MQNIHPITRDKNASRYAAECVVLAAEPVFATRQVSAGDPQPHAQADHDSDLYLGVNSYASAISMLAISEKKREVETAEGSTVRGCCSGQRETGVQSITRRNS
eukprot:107393-Rhodomonas_salina.3